MSTSIASASAGNQYATGVALCTLAGVMVLVAATGLLWFSPFAFAAFACLSAFLIAMANPFYALLFLCAILPFDVYLGSLFVSELVLVCILLGYASISTGAGNRGSLTASSFY
jgi:hypothetical protein